jgi:hypothetical protein
LMSSSLFRMNQNRLNAYVLPTYSTVCAVCSLQSWTGFCHQQLRLPSFGITTAITETTYHTAVSTCRPSWPYPVEAEQRAKTIAGQQYKV